MRFIDLAFDGGCSKKGPANEIRDLLSKVQAAYSGSHLELISKNFPDCGSYVLGDLTLLSTVDVVLPMTLSPSDFGKIVVSHVLSDLYASGGLPLFALCILGLPGGMSAASPEAVEVMTSATEQLSRESTLLVGGHTMVDQQDFYLGFAVVGTPIGRMPFAQAAAQPGDVLLLTKPLGTSIATLRWKLSQASELEHSDVIAGMLQSNREAAKVLSKHELHACTDVTGYGFLGHLYNILFASGMAATVQASRVPAYPSLVEISYPDQSRQALHNFAYVKPYLTLSVNINPLLEALLFDSQVSGGLLICAPPNAVDGICGGLSTTGFVPAIVGQVGSGSPGTIEVV